MGSINIGDILAASELLKATTPDMVKSIAAGNRNRAGVFCEFLFSPVPSPGQPIPAGPVSIPSSVMGIPIHEDTGLPPGILAFETDQKLTVVDMDRRKAVGLDKAAVAPLSRWDDDLRRAAILLMVDRLWRDTKSLE